MLYIKLKANKINMKKILNSQSSKSRSKIILIILLIIIFAGGYIVISKGYFGINDSEAGSKSYNKTYAAGNIVNYKPTPFKYSRGKLVSVRSQGGNIRMPAKPGGPMIDGWRMYHADGKYTNDNEGWVYLSKWITIPTSKRPMAVYVCWRALSRNTSIKIRLSRGINTVWADKKGRYHKNFYHGWEETDGDPNTNYNQIACWGFYDVGWLSDVPINLPKDRGYGPGDLDQYKYKPNKTLKARIFMKVPEGGVELASIKVFTPTKPPVDDVHRQKESEITN